MSLVWTGLTWPYLFALQVCWSILAMGCGTAPWNSALERKRLTPAPTRGTTRRSMTASMLMKTSLLRRTKRRDSTRAGRLRNVAISTSSSMMNRDHPTVTITKVKAGPIKALRSWSMKNIHRSEQYRLNCCRNRGWIWVTMIFFKQNMFLDQNVNKYDMTK